MKPQYFFVTLRTQGRKPFLGRYPELENIAGRTWTDLMKSLPGMQGDEFGTRRDSIIALVRLEAYLQNDPEDTLQQAIEFFINECHRKWQLHNESRAADAPEEVWQTEAEIKHVQTAEELTRFREYILQNMLGGGLYDGWE
ncbi:MAG: hypothetical protein H6581_14295 [Bacteroidia bacterium]|nr:hypothetical protein [Bacteroidia bacterium]